MTPRTAGAVGYLHYVRKIPHCHEFCPAGLHMYGIVRKLDASSLLAGNASPTVGNSNAASFSFLLYEWVYGARRRLVAKLGSILTWK
jgi:hypothetical protein